MIWSFFRKSESENVNRDVGKIVMGCSILCFGWVEVRVKLGV